MARRNKKKRSRKLRLKAPKSDWNDLKLDGKPDIADAFLNSMKTSSKMMVSVIGRQGRVVTYRLPLYSRSGDVRVMPEEKKVKEEEIDELVSKLRAVRVKEQ